jgi:hypothetical protein
MADSWLVLFSLSFFLLSFLSLLDRLIYTLTPSIHAHTTNTLFPRQTQYSLPPFPLP